MHQLSRVPQLAKQKSSGVVVPRLKQPLTRIAYKVAVNPLRSAFRKLAANVGDKFRCVASRFAWREAQWDDVGLNQWPVATMQQAPRSAGRKAIHGGTRLV